MTWSKSINYYTRLCVWICILYTSCAWADEKDVVVAKDNFLVFTDGQAGAVYQMTINGEVTSVISNTQLNPIAIDYDAENQRVLWTDVDQQSIKSSKLDGSDIKTLLKLPITSSLEGLAVDPQARLLFFSDNGRDSISVATYSNNNVNISHKQIVTVAKHPRSLRLDPIKRKLYWSDWGLGTIERVNYDGSERETLVEVAGSPWLNGLALDLIERRLYWTDAKGNRIESASMDGGGDRKIIVEHPLDLQDLYSEDDTDSSSGEKDDIPPFDPHYYGIAIDDRFIYYTDWKNGTIFQMSKNTKEVVPLGWSNHSSLSDLQIYRSNRYFTGPATQCRIKNGGCEQLCLPQLSNKHVCACSDTSRLLDDQRSCSKSIQANGPDLIWLEHDDYFTGYIKGVKGNPSVYLRTKQIKTYSIRSPAWHWSAVDMDYTKNRLYLADKYDRYIVSMSLNGSIDISIIYQGTSGQVNGVAVDWVAGNVYWSDALYNTIMMARDEENTANVRQVVSTEMDTPHGVAVHPRRGRLVWADWGTTDRIETASLNGENRKILVDTDLTNPTGIAIDYAEDRVYWCSSHSVESVTLDGDDRITHSTYFRHQFSDIALYKDFIFATDESKGGQPQLWFFDKKNPSAQGARLGLPRTPGGIVMYDETRQPKYKSPCQSSVCDQLCVPQPDQTAQCVCRDGYQLTSLGTSCEEKPGYHGDAYIYTCGDRLCSVPVQQSLNPPADLSLYCFFNNSKYSFRAMDFNFYQGDIYFSDVEFKVRTIRRSNMYNKDNNSVLVYGVGKVEGIAVDWVASNLYWTDSNLSSIWVSRLDGSHSTILHSKLNQPHGISIDIMQRKLYWSEKAPNASRLMRSNLDGSGVETLLQRHLEKPLGIHIDHKDRKLYWVDNGEIHYLSLDLSARGKLHWPRYTKKPELYDISTYQDYIVVSTGKHLRFFEKASGREASAGLQDSSTTPTTIYDVVAFSSYNQPLIEGDAANSCSVDNGGCAQLCLPTPEAFVCRCVDGMMPAGEGGRECVPAHPRIDYFFMLVDDYTHRIYQFQKPDLSDLSALVFPSGDRPIAVDYDWKEQRIYWSDFGAGLVKRSFINGSDVQIIKKKINGSRIDGLALEHHSRLLYYTDTERNLIGVLSLDGQYHKLLVISGVSSPRAIVLDRNNGHMYYSTRLSRGSKGQKSGTGGTIERRNLDGTGLKILVNESLGSPSGIFLDKEKKKIYWVDAHHERIESANLDGTGREVLVKAETDADPFSIAIKDDYMYWTDWNLRGLFRSSRNGSNITTLRPDLLSGLNDIKYYDSRSHFKGGGRACLRRNGGCSHLCIPLAGETRVCACPDDDNGPVPTIDGFNCPGVEKCPTKIPNGELSEDCHARRGAFCTYRCSVGFGVSITGKISCDSDFKWSADVTQLCSDQTCPILVTPENAEVAGPAGACPALAAPPLMCSHQCRHGYKQIGGDRLRMCMHNRQWSGTDIQCEAMSCAPLPLPPYTVLAPGTGSTCATQRQPVGTQCQYICLEGYTSVYGNQTAVAGNRSSVGGVRTCQEDLSWSGQEVVCERLRKLPSVDEEALGKDKDHPTYRLSDMDDKTKIHLDPREHGDSSLENTSHHVSYIIGAVVAVAVGIAILIGLLILMYRRSGLADQCFGVTMGVSGKRRRLEEDEHPVVSADKLAPVSAASYDVFEQTVSLGQAGASAKETGAHGAKEELATGGADDSGIYFELSPPLPDAEGGFVNPVYQNIHKDQLI